MKAAKFYFEALVGMLTPYEAEEWLDENSDKLSGNAKTKDEAEGEILALNLIKPKAEKSNFEFQRQLLLIKIEALKNDLHKFTKMVAPTHWRSTGTLYSNLNKMEHDVNRFTEISKEDLKVDWIKKELGIED